MFYTKDKVNSAHVFFPRNKTTWRVCVCALLYIIHLYIFCYSFCLLSFVWIILGSQKCVMTSRKTRENWTVLYMACVCLFVIFFIAVVVFFFFFPTLTQVIRSNGMNSTTYAMWCVILMGQYKTTTHCLYTESIRATNCAAHANVCAYFVSGNFFFVHLIRIKLAAGTTTSTSTTSTTSTTTTTPTAVFKFVGLFRFGFCCSRVLKLRCLSIVRLFSAW